MKVAGLVAAAGLSSRMGVPKALLPFRHHGAPSSTRTTFVARIVEVLRASRLHPVVVTVPDDDAVADQIARELQHSAVVLAHNVEPHQGLTGSVRTALQHAAHVDALLVTPVDCPFVDVGLVEALVRALDSSVAAAPAVGGVRGHPAVFTQATFELLCAAGDRGGPRAVLDALGPDVCEVPWNDPRVCEDIDTVEDYERMFGRRPSVKRHT